MKIVLIISSLQGGGAERVISILANEWAASGEIVTILTFSKKDTGQHYSTHAAVNVKPLDLLWPSHSVWQSIKKNHRRHCMLRAAILNEKPDVIISFCDTTNIRVLLAARTLKNAPVLVSERVDPAEHKIPMIWRALREFTYPRAARIVVQTERIKRFFKGRSLQKCVVIPNPVIAPTLEQIEAGVKLRSKDRKRIIAVGRLDYQKGFDLLIEAFSKTAQEYLEWDLHIFGEGLLRKELQKLIEDCGLLNRVFLRGSTKEIYPEYLASDLFVLSSRFEGIPNVLCEAMACGIPSISFDCPTGPRELITHEYNGLLLPPESLNSMVLSLKRMMGSESERSRIGKNALVLAERFELKRILDLWNTSIRNARAEMGLS